MVAPLIVGAARVVGGDRLAARAGRPELLKRVQRREDRKKKIQERAENPLSESQKNAQVSHARAVHSRGQRVKRALPTNTLTGVNRIKAFVASISIFTTAIWFALPQAVLWMIGLFGLGGSSIPLLGSLFPGEVIYMLSYVAIAVIGIGTMVYGCIIYSVRRVSFFSGYKGIIFILCLTGYLIIFVNLFPWFVLWLVAVTYLQED